MEIITTYTFDSLFKKLTKATQTKAVKKANLFIENPFHQSLSVEKLHPSPNDERSTLNVFAFFLDFPSFPLYFLYIIFSLFV